MKLQQRLREIKEVYGVDIEALRNGESQKDDISLNKKRKYKNSFYIPNKIFEEIYRYGIVLKPEIYRVIDKEFTIEKNGGFGYILTLKN
ncbi:hypothetical protein [Fusobacterium varium]|uniref:hypothetical protein n=1 Tax=Fusobacterium varium TaxID=856 RepID=UPI002920425A|nr:hypothetical protein AUSP0054_00057 [uncultured phage]